MKIQIFAVIGSFFFKFLGCGAQPPTNRAHCSNPAFDKHVAFYLNFTMPTMEPNELKKLPPTTVLLDAREKNEYEISHIPNAIHCGYNQFDITKWNHLPKNQPIVVYCSIGYRSEKIAEKFKKAGFSKVYNLYGSIFEWVNQGNAVVDAQGKPTRKVHAYNPSWSKWIAADKAERVW